MKKVIITLVVLLSVVIVTSTYAWCPGSGNLSVFGYPNHSCYEPSIPFCFHDKSCDQFEVDRFRSDMEEYQQCIQDYVSGVEHDICEAKKKANAAISEWNSFSDSF